MPLFRRYIGIHYSGAETTDWPLSELRAFSAAPAEEPVELHPPDRGQKYWTRTTLAKWLAGELLDHPATIVGIDHALGFPMQYQHAHKLSGGWENIVEDFAAHWPTRHPKVTVEFIRKGVCGNAAEREGDPKWRRLCEGDVRKQFHSKAKLGPVPHMAAQIATVFDFDGPGSRAEATHAGLPWLGYLRKKLGEELHLWPFDGWVPEEDRSVLAEVYPALLKASYPAEDRDPHQHDAYTVTRWFRDADAEGTLLRALHPPLPQNDKDMAHWEGWILGVGLRPESDPLAQGTPATAKRTKKGAAQKTRPVAAKKAGGKGSGKPPTKKPAEKTVESSLAREQIHEFADQFHGKLVTRRQLFFLEAALGSLDDTLNEKEVLSMLNAMPPDFSMPPREQLRLIHIDGDFKITTFPAPPAPHDPAEYCRRHPRR